MLEINSYEKQLNGLLIEREELFEQINELKNTIERQEIMIDRMKRCENCGNFESDGYICVSSCIGYNEWQLKNE